MKKLSEKNIYSIFEVSVVLKGISAVIQIITGIFAFFVSKAFLVSSVLSIT